MAKKKAAKEKPIKKRSKKSESVEPVAAAEEPILSEEPIAAPVIKDDGEIPVSAEVFRDEIVPSLYDVKQYIGPRKLDPIDDRKILYTRFNLQCTVAYGARFRLSGEHYKTIGTVARIRLSDVWDDMKRFTAHDTVQNKYGINHEEWPEFCATTASKSVPCSFRTFGKCPSSSSSASTLKMRAR